MSHLQGPLIMNGKQFDAGHATQHEVLTAVSEW